MRIVIDTNVVISAIFWAGKPKKILNSARKGYITFLTSEFLLNELMDVLTAKNKPFKIGKREANVIVKHLKDLAEIITTKSRISVCKDDADNRVLECAIDGKADYIITGDRHLLDIKEIKGIKIINTAGFLKI